MQNNQRKRSAESQPMDDVKLDHDDPVRSRRTRSAEVKKLTPEEKEKLINSGKLENVAAEQTAERMPACGLQLYTRKL